MAKMICHECDHLDGRILYHRNVRDGNLDLSMDYSNARLEKLFQDMGEDIDKLHE